MQHTIKDSLQPPRRILTRHRQAHTFLLRCQQQRLLYLQRKPKCTLYAPLAHSQELTHTLNLVQSNIKYAPSCRVSTHRPEHHAQNTQDLGQHRTVLHELGLASLPRLLERQSCPLHQGIKKIYLVLEVPINGTSRQACSLRHLRQRGTRHPLGKKHLRGSIQQLVARCLRILFGTTSHKSPLSSKNHHRITPNISKVAMTCH